MAERLLDVKNLKTYFFTDEGIVRAVDGVDLYIDKGETLGVVGRVGLRQVGHRAHHHAADPPAARPHRRGPDQLRRARTW